MSFFEGVWNTAIPQNLMPDILGGITEDALNNYLSAHHRYDASKYKFSKTFTGQGQSKFSVDATVEAALRVELPPFSPGNRNLVRVIQFPTGPKNANDRSENSVIVHADDNTLTFSWTTAAGKSFSHPLRRVKFQMDADLAIVTDGSKHSLKFEVTALYIDQAQLKKIVHVWAGADPSCEEKLDALFLSMLQVIAAQIATKLKETIEIPVIDMGPMRLYASALGLKEKVVVLGASGDINDIVRQAHNAKIANCERINTALHNDIDKAGGIIALVYSKRVLQQARRLDSTAAQALLLRSKPRAHEEIWQDLRETRAVIDSLPHVGRHPAGRVLTKRTSKIALRNVGLGVGVAESLLQALASKSVVTDQHNCTDELSLELIKGRACANVHVWNPVINIGPGGLSGRVNLDVWAGIEYFIKKFWDCSWSWDGPHQIGLGLTGTPAITLKTVSDDNGLGIDAKFDLSNVHLKTGINDVIDSIIASLDGPFIAILQAILNFIAALLSLVIVPVKIAIPGQSTALQLSDFSTSRYVRGTASNYLAVDCAAAAVKA